MALAQWPVPTAVPPAKEMQGGLLLVAMVFSNFGKLT